MTAEIALKERLLGEIEKQNPVGRNENIELNTLRTNALDVFRQKGFPERKQEYYRFLNFDPILNPIQVLNPDNTPVNLERMPEWDKNCHRIVLVNGQLAPEHSTLSGLPANVTVQSLKEALNQTKHPALSAIGTLAKANDDPFSTLNSALFADGVFVHIPEKTVLEKPLHIYLANQGTGHILSQPRILLIAENHSKATVIQSFVSGAVPASFTNCLSEIRLGENTHLNFYSFQDEGSEQSQVNTTEASVGKHSNFKSVTVTLGGKLVRNNLNIALDSQECETHLYGYYHPLQNETVDNHSLIDHRYAHCMSNELYKGVIGDGGHAIFNGKVLVRKDAQKTNAYQNNKNILLSDDATVNTNPQLEIYADDVKCSHGSSTGYLDPEQLFYLRSRGISLEKAKILLLKAYAADITDQIEEEELRLWLEQKIVNRYQ